MDEYNAQLDWATDKRVHEFMKSQFNNRTVLSITHRLNNLMEKDKGMVFVVCDVQQCFIRFVER